MISAKIHRIEAQWGHHSTRGEKRERLFSLIWNLWSDLSSQSLHRNDHRDDTIITGGILNKCGIEEGTRFAINNHASRLDSTTDMTHDYQSRANILIDPLGRVRAGSNSAHLSSKEDRKRFHQLRDWAECIVVGGETFRSEPYDRVSLPVISFSRSTREISDWHLEFVEISKKFGSKILVEAGPNLLNQLIEANVINQIHLTRTRRRSDDIASPVFSLDQISDWQMISQEVGDEDVFEVYRPR